MQIELDDAQARLLKDVLTAYVSDMSPEIADTDNPAYRRDLETKREHLRAILAALDPTG
jgi:hypothetical protein